MDETENPEKTFQKSLAISAAVITNCYSLGIFLCDIFTNWDAVLSAKNIHLGNIAYALMKNLGYQLGHSLGFSEVGSLELGAWIARFVGFSMFLALTGAFFTFIHL